MIPTIGRIVLYTFPENEEPPHKQNPVPAIITAVHSNDCVNLRIFPDDHACKTMEWRTSVTRMNQGEGEGVEGWDWPPRV